MPHEKTIGKPDAGNLHVRFDEGEGAAVFYCHYLSYSTGSVRSVRAVRERILSRHYRGDARIKVRRGANLVWGIFSPTPEDRATRQDAGSAHQTFCTLKVVTFQGP